MQSRHVRSDILERRVRAQADVHLKPDTVNRNLPLPHVTHKLEHLVCRHKQFLPKKALRIARQLADCLCVAATVGQVCS